MFPEKNENNLLITAPAYAFNQYKRSEKYEYQNKH